MKECCFKAHTMLNSHNYNSGSAAFFSTLLYFSGIRYQSELEQMHFERVKLYFSNHPLYQAPPQHNQMWAHKMEDSGLVTKVVNKLRLAILDVSPDSFVPFYGPHYKAVVVRFGNGTKGGRWSNYTAASHLEVLPLLQPPYSARNLEA